VLVLGVSYKPDVGDVRESPALKLIELLGGLGAEISYHDPYVPDLRDQGLDLRSVDLDDGTVAAADIVCVVTAHSGIDYADLADRAQLVFDFRNVVPRIEGRVHTL
jgi:UDP-N-acetyl-D-glucosamine dehydrogenase